jgi:hypothetical protein
LFELDVAGSKSLPHASVEADKNTHAMSPPRITFV